MARINISETQFAFAFFHKYLQIYLQEDLFFVFPTLRQEGNPELNVAGADLVINNNLFFQFKVGNILKNGNAREIRDHQLPQHYTPYFRFNIKNSPPSIQFDTLLATEGLPGNTVKYISPLFDYNNFDNDDEAFYDFFRRDPIDSLNYIAETNFDQFLVNNPNIDQTDTHVICYNRESVLNHNIGYIFSDPKPISTKKGISEIRNGVFVFEQGSNDINEYKKYIHKAFNIEEKPLITDSFYELQIYLIVNYNIFWIPVIRNNKKTKKLKIQRLGNI